MKGKTNPSTLNEEVQTQGFAWPWSYAARAAMEAWRWTRDSRFPELVLDTFDVISRLRDSDIGREDECRGRIMNSWGTTFYDDYAKGKGYEAVKDKTKSRWTCNPTAAGRIIYPLAMAVEAMLDGANKSTRGTLGNYLDIARGSLVEFFEDMRFHGQDEAYMWRVERNEHEPLNHQNSYAEALLKLGMLIRDDSLVDAGTRIARYFKSNLQDGPDGTWTWAYKGEHGVGELKRSQIVEDIAHAHLNIAFARNCYNMGVVFDENDMNRFAKTFEKNVYLGDKKFSPRISPAAIDKSIVMKPAYRDHFLCWIQLADFRPDIKDIVEDVVAYRYDFYPLNWLGSPVAALAYAWRLKDFR
jgi:hypothetical protein